MNLIGSVGNYGRKRGACKDLEPHKLAEPSEAVVKLDKEEDFSVLAENTDRVATNENIVFCKTVLKRNEPETTIKRVTVAIYLSLRV